MNYQIFIFSRKEVKIIILCTIVGGVLQFISWKYLQHHPELLNNENSEKVEPKETPTPKSGLRRFFPRGGALIEFVGAKIIINVAGTVIFLAQKGALTAMLLGAGGVLVKKIPTKAVSTLVREALPNRYAEKAGLVLPGEMTITFPDRSFEYMFKMFRNTEIPYEEKKELGSRILINHEDLKTKEGRVRVALCIISMLSEFGKNEHDQFNVANFHILIDILMAAIDGGKIPERIARIIRRKLLRLKLKIDINPEFLKMLARRSRRF